MIRGKRAFLANFIYYSQLYRALSTFKSRRLIIFNYHRIRMGVDRPQSFDEGVFGPNQETLRKQLKWLKLNTEIISEMDLVDHVERGRRLPDTCSMVTFDDGYVDNAELALPVIQELKVPALFFISTQAIQERKLGWWDTIAYLIKGTERVFINLRGRFFYLGGSHSIERLAAIHEIQKWMRKLVSDLTRSLMDELSAACELALPDHDTCTRELMSWDQLREVTRAGITIGSHTHTHRVLSTLSLSDQIEEFQRSKDILEAELNLKVRSIAYPVGDHEDLHSESERLAKRCGYQLGFSFQTGTNHPDHLNPFGICRVSAEESIPLTCAATALPSIFARPRSAPIKPPQTLLSPV